MTDGSEKAARFEVVADAAEAPRDDLAALFDEGSTGFVFPDEPRVE